MRKVKLTLLSLVALGAMSLASCTGAQGEKGDKGDQGEQGPQGEPGENGEDGEDGSLWYTGEGVPSADLGKEGDMYLDTSSNDIYQKESSGWVLKTNIQGDKGEDGEDGENGRPGSDGSDGKTAWSNTILPSENGYVTVDVGSAIEGETVTFTAHPDEGYIVKEFNLNGEPYALDSNNQCSVEMVKNGYVVAATFQEYKNVDISSGDSSISTSTTEDNQYVEFVGDGSAKTQSEVKIESDNSTIIISNTALTAQTSGTSKFTISGDGNTVTISSDASASGFTLEFTGSNNTLIIEGSAEFSGLTISGSGNRIQGSYNNAATQEVSLLAEGEDASMDYDFTGTLTISGDDCSLENVSISGRLIVETNTDGKAGMVDSFTMRNSYFVANDAEYNKKDHGNGFIKLNAKKFNIENNEFHAASNVYNLIEMNWNKSFIVANGSTIKNNVFDMKDATHNAINLYNFESGSYDFSGNSFINLNTNNTNPYRFSNFDNYGDEYNGKTINIDLSNNEMEVVTASSDPAWDTLVLFQIVLEEGKQDALDQFYLTLNNVTYNGTKLTNGTLTQDGTTTFYLKNLLSIYCSNALPIVFPNYTIDGEEESYDIRNNEFVDGQLYSRAAYDADGNLVESLSTKVDGAKFATGNGTVSDPLIISTVEEFNALSKIPVSYDNSSLYFRQTENLTFTSPAPTIHLTGNYDGNDKSITIPENTYAKYIDDSIFTYAYGDLTIQKLTLNINNNAVSLISDTAIGCSNGVEMIKTLTLKDINIEGTKIVANTNNFGLITNNPVQNAKEADSTGIDLATFNFENVNVKFESLSNLGTSTSPLIGSGPIGNVKLNYNNVNVTGDVYGAVQVGFLWGNGAYLNNYGTPNYIGDFEVTGCSYNGTMTGLDRSHVGVGIDNTTWETTYSSWVVNGLKENLKTENTLSSFTGPDLYLSGTSIYYNSSTASNMNSLMINIGQINWSDGNYSNNIKVFIDVTGNDSTQGLTKLTNDTIKVVTSETAIQSGVIGSDFEFNLVTSGRRYGLVNKNNILYVIFESSPTTQSISGTISFNYTHVEDDILKGSKPISFN